MNIKLLSLSVLISTSALAAPYMDRMPAGLEACQANAETPLLFNVLKNSPEEIVVEVGNFKDFLKLKKNQYNYTVEVSGVHQINPGKVYTPKVVKTGVISSDKQTITIPVTETGAYIFKLAEDGADPFWIQKVFSVNKKSNTAPLTEADKLALAQKYSPVLSFEDNEVYWPSSLEYITNQVDVDPQLNEETFVISNRTITQSMLGGLFGSKAGGLNVEFKFKDLLKVLPFYGHHNSVLKYGGKDSSQTRLKNRFGEKHITVYYSVFESVATKEIIVNYHFLYPYDLKNGTVEKGVAPAHIFDRESMSISLNSQKRPNYVIYGAHLASQTMAQLDDNQKAIQEWKTGRVFVPWSDANKLKDTDRPIASIAYGSHGVYPKDGTYGVMYNKTVLLKEKAGGGKRFIHPEFNTLNNPANSKPYKLVDLKLESVTSSCTDARGILAYSGSTVDVLGPTNATFPPFTDREENFTEYLYPDIIFDMKKTEPTKY